MGSAAMLDSRGISLPFCFLFLVFLWTASTYPGFLAFGFISQILFIHLSSVTYHFLSCHTWTMLSFFLLLLVLAIFNDPRRGKIENMEEKGGLTLNSVFG